DRLLLRPRFDDPRRAHWPDALQLPQPFGRRFDDVEDLPAEGAYQLVRVNRSDATDHAGGKVLLYAIGRGRSRGAQEPRLELRAMSAVVNPLAGRADPLAGRDGRCVAYHRHQ